MCRTGSGAEAASPQPLALRAGQRQEGAARPRLLPPRRCLPSPCPSWVLLSPLALGFAAGVPSRAPLGQLLCYHPLCRGATRWHLMAFRSPLPLWSIAAPWMWSPLPLAMLLGVGLARASPVPGVNHSSSAAAPKCRACCGSLPQCFVPPCSSPAIARRLCCQRRRRASCRGGERVTP